MQKYFKTQKEINILIYLFNKKGLTINNIAKEMKISVPTIQRKIYSLGLIRNKEIQKQIRKIAHSGEKNGMYGKKSWSAGLTKKTNKSLKQTSINILKTKQKQKLNGTIYKPIGKRNGMFGKKSWNSGLTKETNVILKNLGIKSSKTKKEKWKNYSKEEKEKRFNQLKEARKSARRKQTIPEMIIEKWLIDNNVMFEKQKSMSYFLMDFYVNNKIVIECMGDYWHINPKFYKNELTATQIKNKERDERKLKYLQKNNIPFLFLWESDIKHNFSEIENKLRNILIS